MISYDSITCFWFRMLKFTLSYWTNLSTSFECNQSRIFSRQFFARTSIVHYVRQRALRYSTAGSSSARVYSPSFSCTRADTRTARDASSSSSSHQPTFVRATRCICDQIFIILYCYSFIYCAQFSFDSILPKFCSIVIFVMQLMPYLNYFPTVFISTILYSYVFPLVLRSCAGSAMSGAWLRARHIRAAGTGERE